MPAVVGALAGAFVTHEVGVMVGTEILGSMLLGSVVAAGAGSLANVLVTSALPVKPVGDWGEEHRVAS